MPERQQISFINNIITVKENNKIYKAAREFAKHGL